MPLVRISAYGWSPEKKKKIAREMHEVLMRNTEAPSEAVWVMFDEMRREDWMIHGTMLSEKTPREIFRK